MYRKVDQDDKHKVDPRDLESLLSSNHYSSDGDTDDGSVGLSEGYDDYMERSDSSMTMKQIVSLFSTVVIALVLYGSFSNTESGIGPWHFTNAKQDYHSSLPTTPTSTSTSNFVSIEDKTMYLNDDFDSSNEEKKEMENIKNSEMIKSNSNNGNDIEYNYKETKENQPIMKKKEHNSAYYDDDQEKNLHDDFSLDDNLEVEKVSPTSQPTFYFDSVIDKTKINSESVLNKETKTTTEKETLNKYESSAKISNDKSRTSPTASQPTSENTSQPTFYFDSVIDKTKINSKPISNTYTKTTTENETSNNHETSISNQNPKKENSSSKIKRISILAERNTGLSWFANKIKDCFPDIEVTLSLTRPSHWFQSPDIPIEEPTIVLPLFLNPYHWVDTMRASPHYSPAHKQMEWVQFVSTPWTIHRSKEELDLKSNAKDDKSIECQFGFQYNEIISCLDQQDKLGKDAPIYELKPDGTGRPYSSILELRRDKILNWLNTTDWNNVEFVHPVHYELLTKQGGLLSVIKVIEIKTKIVSTCAHEEIADVFAPIFWDDVPNEYINWMRMNVMWDVEYRIGYDKAIRRYHNPKKSPSNTPYPTNSMFALDPVGMNPPAISPTP